MKRNTFTLLCLAALMCTTAIAQPAVKRQWGAGSDGNDLFTTMCITRDKGWIVGGTSNGNSSCQKTENNRDSTGATSDFWIIKYDNSGAIAWDKTIGGSGNDGLSTIEQTYDGGYILGGTSYSNKSGEKRQNSRGSGDYWVVKLDSSGKIQRSKTFGGDALDALSSVQQTLDSGYLLYGYSASGKSGEKSTDATGNWMVKLDKTGEIEWDKVVAASGQLRQTRDGGYVIGGGVSLTKLDDKGNILWSKIVVPDWVDLDADGNYNDDCSLYLVEQTDDDGYILGGKLGPSTGPFEGSGYFVVKTDSLGKIRWSREYGLKTDFAYNILKSIQQTKDQGYILGGITDYPIDLDNYSYDHYIVKLNKNGKFRWGKLWGGNSDEGNTLVREMSRNKYLVGSWSQSDIGKDKTIALCGSDVNYFTDFWLFRLTYTTPAILQTNSRRETNNAETLKFSNRQFYVYPNPVKDIVHIQIKGTATVSLTDISGKIVLTQIITGNGSINVATLQSGIYFLKNNTTGETKKIIIAH